MAETLPFPPSLVRQMEGATRADARLVPCPAAVIVSVRAVVAAQGRVAQALGLRGLPAPNRVLASSSGDCLWVRPDEWLVVGPHGRLAAVVRALEAAVGPAEGAVVDLSASRIVMELSGPASRDVLAGSCPLDLHPGVFAPGCCAQSLIAKAPVLLQLADDSPRWRIFVRPSLAAYVVGWVADAMGTG